MFGHTETHVLVAPEGVPVQRLLLSSLSSQGPSNGGVQFEVWCRLVVAGSYHLKMHQNTMVLKKIADSSYIVDEIEV